MPCLLGCFALSAPRLVLLVLWLFSDYINRAYDKNVWPLLGFFFLPATTLAVAAARNEHGSVEGWWIAIVVLAVLFDLGAFRSRPWKRRPRDGGDDRGDGGATAPSGRPREITVRGERVG